MRVVRMRDALLARGLLRGCQDVCRAGPDVATTGVGVKVDAGLERGAGLVGDVAADEVEHAREHVSVLGVAVEALDRLVHQRPDLVGALGADGAHAAEEAERRQAHDRGGLVEQRGLGTLERAGELVDVVGQKLAHRVEDFPTGLGLGTIQGVHQLVDVRADQVGFDARGLGQAMGGILQDSINEMGAKAVLKGGGNPLQGVLGSLGGLQTSIQNEWKNQEADFQQFGKDVCKRVVSLEDSRKALVGTLK